MKLVRLLRKKPIAAEGPAGLAGGIAPLASAGLAALTGVDVE